MANLQLSQASLAFGGRDILRGVSLNLSATSRVALSGANGSGKTTLMKILCGLIKPDSGSLVVQKDASVSYLPQSGIVHAGATLLDEAERAFDPIRAYIRRAEAIAAELATHSSDGPRTRALLETLHHHQEHVQDCGYHHRAQVIEQVLIGLGFKKEDFERPSGEFSGGWQMRIALAKVLLERPDFMLLDEPTNYLDLEARLWLQDYIQSFGGGVLLVSHDRHFLDRTCDEVVELFNGRLSRYRGNYSEYERTRQAELVALMAAYEKQQEEIAHHEEFVRRFRYNESKAALVQSRIKMLEKIVPIELPESMKRLHFSFPPAPHSGRIVLSIEGLSRAYGGLAVLRDLDLTVERGEKLALVGKNGAGKSTLMRIVAGRDNAYGGSFRLGAGVTVGYFAQEAETGLDQGLSVLETIESVCPTGLFPKARGMLGAFLFRGDDVFKSVSVLSGGEKSRLALLVMLLHPSNLLVLDEPTNHLDLPSKDVLLQALQDFDGTVVFVSHDRYFLDRLATRVLELRAGLPARLFPGGYEYYLQRAEEPVAASTTVVPTAPPATAGREDAKRRRSELRRLEREEELLMNRIEDLEAEHASLQARLASPDIYSDGESVKKIKTLLAANEAAASEAVCDWERAARRREQLGVESSPA